MTLEIQNGGTGKPVNRIPIILYIYLYIYIYIYYTKQVTTPTGVQSYLRYWVNTKDLYRSTS